MSKKDEKRKKIMEKGGKKREKIMEMSCVSSRSHSLTGPNYLAAFPIAVLSTQLIV